MVKSTVGPRMSRGKGTSGWGERKDRSGKNERRKKRERRIQRAWTQMNATVSAHGGVAGTDAVPSLDHPARVWHGPDDTRDRSNNTTDHKHSVSFGTLTTCPQFDETRTQSQCSLCKEYISIFGIRAKLCLSPSPPNWTVDPDRTGDCMGTKVSPARHVTPPRRR
jgi:hypothetical protein